MAELSKKYRISPGSRVDLKKISSEYPGNYQKEKESLKKEVQKLTEKMGSLQERLFAEKKQSLLIVLQAMDTGGKDSTICSVFSSINPQGCRVYPFKKPTPLELSHHYLWRIMQKIPAKGYINIFNRSHYEDVLITRVQGQVSKQLAKRRFKEIRDFETMLSAQGTQILKFFLHISKEEQKKRLQERLDNPNKYWKFNEDDLQERKKWGQYQRYYQEAIEATSQNYAPWFVIPSNKKWFRNRIVAEVVYGKLKKMDPAFPPPPPGFDPKKIRIP
jgi:PPK2 family polyphosphate:nucleotide phosphotransferase